MAWTQNDKDALKLAMQNGVRVVQYSDNRRVEYRTMAEMIQLLALMEADINSVAPSTAGRSSFASFSKE